MNDEITEQHKATMIKLLRDTADMLEKEGNSKVISTLSYDCIKKYNNYFQNGIKCFIQDGETLHTFKIGYHK